VCAGLGRLPFDALGALTAPGREWPAGPLARRGGLGARPGLSLRLVPRHRCRPRRSSLLRAGLLRGSGRPARSCGARVLCGHPAAFGARWNRMGRPVRRCGLRRWRSPGGGAAPWGRRRVACRGRATVPGRGPAGRGLCGGKGVPGWLLQSGRPHVLPAYPFTRRRGGDRGGRGDDVGRIPCGPARRPVMLRRRRRGLAGGHRGCRRVWRRGAGVRSSGVSLLSQSGGQGPEDQRQPDPGHDGA